MLSHVSCISKEKRGDEGFLGVLKFQSQGELLHSISMITVAMHINLGQPFVSLTLMERLCVLSTLDEAPQGFPSQWHS